MSGGVATVARLAVSVTGDVDDLKTAMADAQSVVGAAAKDMAVNVSAVSDSTDQVTAAGKRMVAALQEEVRTFGMSREEILIYKASLTGAGDEVARLVGQLQSLKAAQAAAPQLSADTEATQRIRDMVAASVAQTAAMNESAGAAQNLTTAQAGAARVAASWADSQRLQAQNMAGVAASMRAATAGTQELSAQTQAIMNRYDPLGTKLRALQSDLATLRKEMGNSVDPAAMKAFQGLEEEIDATREKMAKAGVEGFGSVEKGAAKSAFATAGATRELMVLGHEVISGNFSRVPGSLMVLAERTGGFATMVEALTGSLGVMAVGAALTVGPLALMAAAAYQGHQDFIAMNAAMGLTNNYAGQTADSMSELAARIGAAGQMTTGTAKQMVISFVASGQIGAQAFEKIALLAGNYAKATGESVDEVTPKLIQLFNNPKQGAEELKNSMHLLTAENVGYIAALEDSGQHQQAQLVLAEALARHLALQTTQVTGLTSAWRDFTGVLSNMWDIVKQHVSGAATATPYQAALQAAQEQLDQMQGTPNLGGDPELDKQIAKQKQLIADMIAGHQAEAAAAKKASDQESADAEKKNAIYTELHKGQLQRIEDLKKERAILDDAPDTSAVEARRAEIDNQILQIQRSIGAEGRQLTQQQITDGEQYNLLVLHGQASRLQNQLNFGAITKEQFDEGMTQNALYQNAEKQDYERRMANVAGLTAAERQGHLNKLKYLQEEASQIVDNGKAAVAIDEKKIADDSQDAMNKYLSSLDAEARKLEDANTNREQHKSTVERETIALLDQAIALQQLQNLEMAQDQVTAKEMQQGQYLLQYLEAQRVLRERIASALDTSEVDAANKKAAQAAQAAWQHAANTIENDLTNAILDGGGRGWQKLIRDMEMAFAKLVLQPILSPISGGLATMAAPGVAAASAGGSALSGGIGAAGLLGGASIFGAGGLGGAIAGGAGWLTGATTLGGSLTAAGSLIGTGATAGIASGVAMGVGALAPIALGIVAGVSLLKKAFGMGDKSVTSEGMSGTLSADALTGSNYSNWHQSGGWLRSDRNGTDTTGFSAQTVSQFTQGLAAIEQASSGFAKSLGVDADWVSTYSKAFDITLTGDATKDAQAVTDFFNGVGDDLANKLVPNLAQFSKTGETASATLQRLAGDFASTNQIAQLIGKTGAEMFGSLGMDSAAARERVIDLAGGVSTLSQQAQSYATNYLTDAQKLVPVQKALDAAMASLGLSSVQTRDQFKAIVDSLDLATEAGAQEFASLMALSDAFAQVHAAGRSAADILSERQNLQDQYDQLTMTATQLAQKQRDALDDSNKALFDQIQALKDQAQAATDAAAAAQAAKATASGLLGDVDNAFTVLQNVTKTTTDAISARITAEQALSSAIKSTISSMNPQSIGLNDRAAAQAQIKDAIAAVKAGGALPDAASLQSAFATVSKDASAQFGTYADYLKDLYSTKNDLLQLGGMTDSALSVDQAQLNTLNDQLKAAQQQIDLLKGIDTSGLTIAQALAGFQTAAASAQANPIVSANSGISDLYHKLLGRAPDAAGLAYWNQVAASGQSLDSIGVGIMGGSEYADHQKKLGIPGFASGGDFAGGLRIVGENGPELEATGPARIFNASQTSSLMARLSSPSDNSAVLVAAIKTLTDKVEQQQKALDKIAKSTEDHKNMFDTATAGGGPLLVEFAQ